MEIYKNLSLEDLPNEEWRDIVGYEGLYQVSNMGRVKSLERLDVKNQYSKEIQIMKQQLSNSGYLTVCVTNGSKKKLLLVHREVCNAFVNNKENLPCVNHKDENKLNNKVGNLEFCTYKYNCNYGTRNERVLKSQIENSKYFRKVFQYDKNGSFLKEWGSIHEIFKETYKKRVVYECCIRMRGSGFGYLWRFYNDCSDIVPYKIEAHNKKQILCFDKDTNFLREYNSITDAAKDVGASIGNIVSCCKGNQKTSKGYIFRYK